MKPEAARSIAEFAKANTLLSSYYRALAAQSADGRKQKSTIERKLRQRTRFAFVLYCQAFGEDLHSEAAEREAAKRLAADFGIIISGD